MAGAIVPAIASTNAIIGALIVVEAIKVLRGQVEACRYQNYGPTPTGRRSNALLQCFPMQRPNKSCYVCGQATVHIGLDTTEEGGWTLGQLVEAVVRKHLGFASPNVSIGYRELLTSDPE
eukprot:SAG31_NODE_8645_length_1414_cov_1.825856_3_plen_119_part_01